jgi:hypothetical protein
LAFSMPTNVLMRLHCQHSGSAEPLHQVPWGVSVYAG